MLRVSNIIIALYVLTTSFALIALKLGSKAGAPISFVDHRLLFNINFYMALGVFLYGSSFLLYTYLISKFDLGYIIPLVTAFVYVAIFVASFIIFKESFTAIKVVAIGFILVGIVLLNLNK